MEDRLQKIIARAGVTSRRKAEVLILSGAVTVNGKTVMELGVRADPATDHIKVHGKLIRPEPLEYYAVNKPRSVLCSVSDPGGRPVVTNIVPSTRRLYPAGRLDFDSEGLVILTNDGDLTRAVTRAGGIPKCYRVKVLGKPPEGKLERLRRGVRVGGESYSGCQIKLLKSDSNTWLEIRLHEGKNREVRRLFESIGHPVMRLRRTAIGPVELGKIPVGGFRSLTAAEVSGLKAGASGVSRVRSGGETGKKDRSKRPRSRIG